MSVKNVFIWFFLTNVCLSPLVLSKTKSLMWRIASSKQLQVPKVFDPKNVHVTESKCGILPQTVLIDVLGAAFNSRYMSIELPKDYEEEMGSYHRNKRHSEFLQPFYVDDSFAIDISDKPAWEVRHGSASTSNSNNFKTFMTNMGSDRSKRDARRGTNTLVRKRNAGTITTSVNLVLLP